MAGRSVSTVTTAARSSTKRVTSSSVYPYFSVSLGLPRSRRAVSARIISETYISKRPSRPAFTSEAAARPGVRKALISTELSMIAFTTGLAVFLDVGDDLAHQLVLGRLRAWSLPSASGAEHLFQAGARRVPAH